MTYTANDFQKLVEKYMKTPEGKAVAQTAIKKQTAQQAGYAKERVEQIARKMRDEIVKAMTEIAVLDKSEADVFAEPHISIGNVTSVDTGSGTLGLKIVISFDEVALHRDSLWREGYPQGVYDIIGLLTQGYESEDSVYGNWMSVDGDTELAHHIASAKRREGNAFIKQIAERYKAMYPGLNIELPREWIKNG